MSATPRELAYAAGFFDGEGSVTIAARKPYGRSVSPHHNLLLQTANTDRPLLIWFQEKWGGSLIDQRNNHYNPRCRPCWSWKINGWPAVRFLHQVLPFLRSKRVQADLALAFYYERTLGARHRLSPEELALREGYKLALQEAKKQ